MTDDPDLLLIMRAANSTSLEDNTGQSHNGRSKA